MSGRSLAVFYFGFEAFTASAEIRESEIHKARKFDGHRRAVHVHHRIQRNAVISGCRQRM